VNRARGPRGLRRTTPAECSCSRFAHFVPHARGRPAPLRTPCLQGTPLLDRLRDRPPHTAAVGELYILRHDRPPRRQGGRGAPRGGRAVGPRQRCGAGVQWVGEDGGRTSGRKSGRRQHAALWAWSVGRKALARVTAAHAARPASSPAPPQHRGRNDHYREWDPQRALKIPVRGGVGIEGQRWCQRRLRRPDLAINIHPIASYCKPLKVRTRSPEVGPSPLSCEQEASLGDVQRVAIRRAVPLTHAMPPDACPPCGTKRYRREHAHPPHHASPSPAPLHAIRLRPRAQQHTEPAPHTAAACCCSRCAVYLSRREHRQPCLKIYNSPLDGEQAARIAVILPPKVLKGDGGAEPRSGSSSRRDVRRLPGVALHPWKAIHFLTCCLSLPIPTG